MLHVRVWEHEPSLVTEGACQEGGAASDPTVHCVSTSMDTLTSRAQALGVSSVVTPEKHAQSPSTQRDSYKQPKERVLYPVGKSEAPQGLWGNEGL